MTGWSGKILRVDLTKGELSEEELPAPLAQEYLGGRGLAAKILLDELDPTVDPFDPGNRLVLATGPLTGSGAVATGRYVAVTKSPLTGGLVCGDSGGHFPAELKLAGYDLVVIAGRAEEPVYLWIDDGKVELRPADHLWGKDTYECEKLLIDELGQEVKVASIGPAGEKLVKTATLVNEKLWAVNGAGIGTIMGAKKLKALAVRGTAPIRVADQEGFREATWAALDSIKGELMTSRNLPNYGTAVLAEFVNERGLLPTHNFQEGVFARLDEIDGHAITNDILSRKTACFACPIACIRITSTGKGSFEGGGPEYGAVWALGACCGVADLVALAQANYTCHKLGMDAVEAGVTIACAMELSEKGLLPEEKVGFKLRFGDAKALNRLLEEMGQRRGFGDLLAEGGYHLASRYGDPGLFMGVKRGALAAHDPRGDPVMSLHHATASDRACAVPTSMVSARLLGLLEEPEPKSAEGVAAWAKAHQDFIAVADSAGVCRWATFAIGIREIMAMLKAATGIEYNRARLHHIGEKIWNVERLFNQRAGLTAEDDTLPDRMLKEPLTKGAAREEVAHLDDLLPAYYLARGWNEEGVPTAMKLKQLGLPEEGV